MDGLREAVMINQFMMTTGCGGEQAKQTLQAAQWQFETALSVFFQEVALPSSSSSSDSTTSDYNSLNVVHNNTPVTPPRFQEALISFAKLKTTDKKSDNNKLNARSMLSQGSPSCSMVHR